MNKKQKKAYILLPICPNTYRLDSASLSSFARKSEVLKAKAFLRKSNIITTILEVDIFNNKEDFCKEWQSKIAKSLEKEVLETAQEQTSVFIK